MARATLNRPSARSAFLVLLALALFTAFVAADVLESIAKERQTLDGVGNNKKHNWGAALQTYLTNNTVPHTYLDGVGKMREEPSARVISNALFSLNMTDALNPRRQNIFLSGFGQFVCHELLRTIAPSGNEDFFISVPKDDPFFDPFGEGGKTIKTSRALIDPSSGKSTKRAILNFKTPFIDAGEVYGPSMDRLNAVRNETHREYFAHQVLPNGETIPLLNTKGLLNEDNSTRKDLFLFADERVNIQPLLFSTHVLFRREHNRIVDELKNNTRFAGLSSDDLFFEARRRVTAYIQNIILNEHVPAITGYPLPEYTGYKEDVNPQVMDLFVAVASRYGHSELPPSIVRLEDGDVASIPLLLRDIIFHPELYAYEGIDSIIRGSMAMIQMKTRAQYPDDFRNFLFGFPGKKGTDLAAIEVQRARDFGVPLYNDARQMMGLERVSRYEEVISDPKVVSALEELYGKNPDNAETFVMGFAEKKTPESNFGPLFNAIMREQFIRTRDGDRFFFESKDAGFTEAEIAFIKTQTITDIVLRNTGIYELPCSGFYALSQKDCTKPRPINNSTGTLGNSTNSASFFGGDVTIRWEFVGKDEITISVTSLSTGWVAFAFAQNPGNMLNADAIIGFGSGSNIDVQDYNIFGQRREGCPGVCPDTLQGGSNDILEFSGMDDGSSTRFTFRRKLNTGDDKDVPILNDGNPTAILIAFGSSDELGYHGGNKVSAEINFYTGFFGVTDSHNGPHDRLTVHGVLMVFSWLFVFPLGIFLVKFCKRLLLRWWFRLHMIIQYLGTLIVICALILAVEAIAAEGHEHIHNAHAILGIITVSLAIIVPALGQLTSLVWTPTRKYALFPDWIHYILGYAAPMFSCVTIFFGIWERTKDDDKSWWWYFLVGLWIVIVVLLFLVCWFFQIVLNVIEKKNRNNEDEGEDEGKEEKPQDEDWSSEEESD